MSAEFADAYAYCNSRTGDVLRLACAVDGSRVSHKALDLSLHLTNVSRGDTLDLLHVVEASAPSHLRPEHVMNECDLQTSTAGVQADFHRLSKSPGETVTAVLAKGAAAYRADLLVVGAIGLRIEQGNVHAHGESFSVTGSVSDGSLQRSDVSTCIVKSTSRKVTPSAGKTILVATDDSPSARLAFALVVTKLANRGKDLVHVYTNSDNLDHVETMLKKYAEACADLGLECKTYADRDRRTNVADNILKRAETVEADVLVVGTNGHAGESILGSVSRRCAQTSRCTTIVVKDPRM